MSTALRASEVTSPVPHPEEIKIGIVRAEWNGEITSRLLQGAIDSMKQYGYDESNMSIYHVPGSVELTFGAAQLVRSGNYDAVIVLGCVVRGETPHFDYVCQSVTQGVSTLNANYNVPVIFGVLTTESQEQAEDRAGGILGNKGSEAVETALKMIDFYCKMK